jgi:hypothetical protein
VDDAATCPACGCTGGSRSGSSTASASLDIALGLAQQVGNPPQLWKTFGALGQLRLAQDRAKEAGQAHRDALAVIDGVAAALNDESLRAAFLASDHIQAFRDAAAQITA